MEDLDVAGRITYVVRGMNSHSVGSEDSYFLGCGGVSLAECFPTFRTNVGTFLGPLGSLKSTMFL